MASQGVEIEIHLINGSKVAFVIDDPETIAKLTSRPDPPNFFGQANVAFENPSGVTLFPTSHVNRIDINCDQLPPWKMATGVDGTMTEITREQFNRLYVPHESLALTRQKYREVGDDFQGFVYVRFTNGDYTILTVKMKLPPAIQQRMILEPLLSRPSIFCARAGRGILMLNPRNVLRIDLLPGLPAIVPDAMPAREKSITVES